MPDTTKPCDLHLDIVRFQYRLGHLTRALNDQRKIKIVAIGSSSAAGEGDVIPFPHRLELALRKRFPDRMIDVLNRGIGGQEAPEELSRFESDVLAEMPTLVIWQVGTNAIYHRELYDPPSVATTIATGVSWLKRLETDVILMDLQYAPILLEKQEHDTRLMVSLISSVARAMEVNLFPRFALMKQWEDDGIAPDAMFGSDGLHQTDFSTNCVARSLDLAMGAATGPIPTAPAV
jgi:lysophospholipase L1-like esterase